MANLLKKALVTDSAWLRVIGVPSVFLALSLAGRANADLIIGFSDDGGARFTDAYSITTGDGELPAVFQRESDTTILQLPGWAGFDFVGAPSQATLGTLGTFAVNSVFDVPGQNSSATKLEMSGAEFGEVTTTPFLDSSSPRLATVNLRAFAIETRTTESF